MDTKKTYGIRKCAWCENEFEARRSNQIFCQPTCTRAAANKKIIENYHASKRKRTEVRTCDDCGARLSKYNDDDTCSPCRIKRRDEERIDLLRRLGFEYINDEDA